MLRRDFCKLLGAGLVMPEFLVARNPSAALPCAPMLGRPQQDGVTINVLAGPEMQGLLRCRHRPAEGGVWCQAGENAFPADGVLETRIMGLTPGRVYSYEIFSTHDSPSQVVHSGMFSTRPLPGAGFSAALISDMHLLPGYGSRGALCQAACEAALARDVDFAILLGDNFQTLSSHGGPMTHDRMGPNLYGHLRSCLGALPGACPVFHVNGNWDGENGWHSQAERARARAARMLFMPNPDPATYPQGGSPAEDYYAFTWSDVLCVVLNVTGYTLSDHAIGSTEGRADDWTLGRDQFAWLERVLAGSGEKWKLVFIHHTVGGYGADDLNSRYGRGGGRAAKVGEQARVHDLLVRYGVRALFYGHDHVFTDMEVDGVHYTCVGSAGAPWLFDSDVTGYAQAVREPGFTLVDYDGSSVIVRYITLAHLPAGRVAHEYRMATV
jgi:predicted phosphodiesterase